MKLLAALAATTATELNLSKATAVAVYASAITIIKTVANDGTEGGTGGTVLGSVTLPAASSNSGRIIMVKDSGGNSHSNNITISRNGSDVIDGEASIVLESPYAAVTLVCNGSNWFIL